MPKFVVFIARFRVQYGKYFTSFSYFETYLTKHSSNSKILQNMRIEENICQYCTRQRVVATLSLNACCNQMKQELSYLLTYCVDLA